jgi:hypothetical protein
MRSGMVRIGENWFAMAIELCRDANRKKTRAAPRKAGRA